MNQNKIFINRKLNPIVDFVSDGDTLVCLGYLFLRALCLFHLGRVSLYDLVLRALTVSLDWNEVGH